MVVLDVFMCFVCVYKVFDHISAICVQVIQLRKASSHPYLFPGIEPEPFEEGEHLVQVALLSYVNLI